MAHHPHFSDTISPQELNALAADVVRLSQLLTRNREDLPAAYLNDAGLRRAYVRYFLPANISKIALPLAEVSRHPKNPFSRECVRILDIGSGPGTALLGALTFFSRQEQPPVLDFTAVDQIRENLWDAEALFEELKNETGSNAALKTVRSGVEHLSPMLQGRYDIIILSNVVNELFHAHADRIARRLKLLETILSGFLANDGSCIIIEPALRETSREMLMVRECLLERGFHAYAPCLNSGKCAALVNPKDWCHEDVPWDPPELIRRLDRLTGLRKDSLKFSYVVLRKDRLSLSDVSGPDAFRVVSEPLVTRGKIEFYLCGSAGRKLVVRLDKDGTSANACFGGMKRGDIAVFEGLVEEEKRFKVTKETRVLVK